MMRTAILLLFLAVTSSASWIRGETKAEQDGRRVRKGGDGGDGPCGLLSAELQDMWGITDQDCVQADAARDDTCIPGPITVSGNSGCTTTEHCQLNSDPNHSCIVSGWGGSFVDSQCGTVPSVALQLGVNTYQLNAVCPGNVAP